MKLIHRTGDTDLQPIDDEAAILSAERYIETIDDQLACALALYIQGETGAALAKFNRIGQGAVEFWEKENQR